MQKIIDGLKVGPEINGRELTVTRILNASPQLVWKAWTDPKHLAIWWGPAGFKTTIHEINVKPGGMWRYIMHGPDGTDFHNRIVYEEVVKPKLLVYKLGTDIDNDPDAFHVTVTMEELSGKTKVTMHCVLKSAEVLDELIKKYKVDEGSTQTLDRLELELETMK